MTQGLESPFERGRHPPASLGILDHPESGGIEMTHQLGGIRRSHRHSPGEHPRGDGLGNRRGGVGDQRSSMKGRQQLVVAEPTARARCK